MELEADCLLTPRPLVSEGDGAFTCFYVRAPRTTPQKLSSLTHKPQTDLERKPIFFPCLPEGDWQCSPELASLIKELNSGPFTMYVILCGWKETWRRERKQALKPPEIGRQTSGMRLLQGSSPQIKPGTEIHLQVIRLKSGLGFIVSC